jgi:hypothetical protein
VIAVPTPTTTITIAVGSCRADALQLTTSVLNVDVAPAVNEGAVTLTNVSAVACGLLTTPVFEIVGTTGAVVATTVSNQVVNDVVRPGETQGANLNWENWCGPDVRPLTLLVVLPSGGGTLSSPYGNSSTALPACANSAVPTNLFAHGGGGPGTLLGG